MAIRSTRDNLERAFRKYRAICILTNALDKDGRAQADHDMSVFQKLPSIKIRSKHSEIKSALKFLVNKFGVIATLEDLESLFTDTQRIKQIGPNSYLLISKYQLLHFFKKYEKAFPHFAIMPLHGRIGIDIQSLRDNIQEVEFFQIDVSLFEDMAALWNEAQRADISAQEKFNKVTNKHAAAIMRATAKAAFNFLEGYLNGLACDIPLIKDVSTSEKSFLDEWDYKNNRAKYLSLRDKILQYPKIAIGVLHPPLQESSCPEITRIIELESSLRHALIHPKPEVIPSDPMAFREATYFELELSTVAILVDDIIELIFKIAALLGKEYGDVSDWLERRNKDGLFNASVFS